jgi:ABC-type bacteriocin/lantibiotic exporter with double-glycine peptidase domain
VTRHLRLTQDSRQLLVIGVLVSVGQAALLVPIPLVVRHVFDSDLKRGRAGGVVLGGVVVLALYLGGSGLALVSRYAVLKATKRGIADLRSQLSTQLYALPKSFHDRTDPWQLHATIVQDSERLDVVANAAIGQMLPASVVSLGLAVVALVLDPALFALLACSVPAMVLVKRRFGSRVGARTRTWQQAFDRFSVLTQTALRARTLADVRGADQLELGRLTESVEALSDAGLEMAWRQGCLSVAQGTIVAVAAVLVLVVGGSAVASGAMSTGDLISFYALVALLQGQVTTITVLLPIAISGRESLERLNSFLDVAERAPYRGTGRIDFQGAIELRGVSFGYGRELVLREFELTIAPGENIVILGPNGAGKSSLASLILGLYRPTSGELLADGVPYEQLDMRALRTAFGVLLQDPLILPGTVAENIAYGRPAASSRDIERAAVLAGANVFVQQLPAGYGSKVGAEGGLLSGGQRQRVALARALLGEPRLLILDEPTTHLDGDAIAGIRAALDDLTTVPTVITITHDEVLAGQADRVIHLRDGRIAPAALASISGTAA